MVDDDALLGAAAALRVMLAEVEGGALSCSAATRHRMEGALIALTSAGHKDDIDDKLQDLTR